MGTTVSKDTKYLSFVRKPDIMGRKTPMFDVINKSGTILGEVRYYPGWRKLCYFPAVQATYDSNCLSAISEFMEEQNEKRK